MSLLVKHFIATPKAIEVLVNLNLNQNEKQELAETTLLIYHQQLLNKFLEILEQEDRKIFMDNLLSEDQEKAFEFLHEKIQGIEQVVEQAVAEIEEKLLNDFALLEDSKQ